MPVTASRDLRETTPGKNTCKSKETPVSKCVCPSRPAAPGGRVLRERTVGAGRPAATVAERSRHYGRSGLYGLRQRRRRPYWRSFHLHRNRERHAEPARDLRLLSEAASRRERVRNPNPFTNSAPGLPPARDT